MGFYLLILVAFVNIDKLPIDPLRVIRKQGFVLGAYKRESQICTLDHSSYSCDLYKNEVNDINFI